MSEEQKSLPIIEVSGVFPLHGTKGKTLTCSCSVYIDAGSWSIDLMGWDAILTKTGKGCYVFVRPTYATNYDIEDKKAVRFPTFGSLNEDIMNAIREEIRKAVKEKYGSLKWDIKIPKKTEYFKLKKESIEKLSKEKKK